MKDHYDFSKAEQGKYYRAGPGCLHVCRCLIFSVASVTPWQKLPIPSPSPLSYARILTITQHGGRACSLPGFPRY